MSTSVQHSKNLLASIDLGTNSFKLLIINFDPTTSTFTTLYHHSSPVILGRGSSPSSSSSPPFISPESQLKAIQTLSEFLTILRSHNVSRTRVVGTSAIREASNREDFLHNVIEKVGSDGFVVDVLSGFDEGRLVYLGVLQFFPYYVKKVLTFDIGGGSTEFVIGENGGVVFVESLRLGHVTLTQNFGGDLMGLRRYVREQIEGFGLVGKLKDFGFEVAIGSSGTIRAIEKAIWRGYGCEIGDRLSLGRKWWWFSKKELSGLVERLCMGLDCEEERGRREEFFGRRSEFIVAGAVLLEVILEVLEIDEVRVSGYALGEGVVAEMVSEDFPGCDFNANVRWRSVMRLAMRFNGKDRMKNGGKCAAFAKDMFEGLRNYSNSIEVLSTHGIRLHGQDLEYLEAACMLHNIGLYYGKKGYHKRSCSIILEHNQLDGYTTEEIELISQLVRHHRKKFPGLEHYSFKGFSQEKFGILCSILRISVIFQQDKSLKLKEVKFYHGREGFILALVEKDQPSLPDSQKPMVRDIEKKIGKEAELFEVVFHQKMLVAAHTP